MIVHLSGSDFYLVSHGLDIKIQVTSRSKVTLLFTNIDFYIDHRSNFRFSQFLLNYLLYLAEIEFILTTFFLSTDSPDILIIGTSNHGVSVPGVFFGNLTFCYFFSNLWTFYFDTYYRPSLIQYLRESANIQDPNTTNP